MNKRHNYKTPPTPPLHTNKEETAKIIQLLKNKSPVGSINITTNNIRAHNWSNYSSSLKTGVF